MPRNVVSLPDGPESCQARGLAKASPGWSLDLYTSTLGNVQNGQSQDGAGCDEKAKLCRARMARRFYVQCRDGIWVAQERGLTVRTFVLTESDYAIGMELDWQAALRKFYKKMRYDYGQDVGMCWVEHLQGEKVRRNRHIVEFGAEKLDLEDLNDFWLRVYGSLVTWRKKRRGGMVVGSAEKCARYLAEYFTGEGFVRAHFSHNWVFPGWFDYGKWCRKVDGAYPGTGEMAKLASLGAADRLSVPRYRAWYESCQDKLKVRLAEKLLGPDECEAAWAADYKRRHHKVRPWRFV